MSGVEPKRMYMHEYLGGARYMGSCPSCGRQHMSDSAIVYVVGDVAKHGRRTAYCSEKCAKKDPLVASPAPQVYMGRQVKR